MKRKNKYLTGIILLCIFVSCQLPDGMKTGYKTENNKIVHYSGFPAHKVVVDQADVKSFISINDNYGKDKNNVYLDENIINNADAQTFEYLGGPYSKDKNNAYYQSEVLSDDAAGFRILTNSDNPGAIIYALDSKLVYKDSWIVKNADAATFTFVPMFNGYYLAYDKYKVYFNEIPLDDADGAGFQKVSGLYFKDKANAWALLLGKDSKWEKIPNADPGSFEAVKEFYAKDKKNVFYENKVVAGADISSFKETTIDEAKDKNGSYSRGILTNK